MTYEISGTWRFQDVMQLGGPHEIKEIRANQHTIQFDEPANIQFTSVSYFFHLIRVAYQNKIIRCYLTQGTTGNPKGVTLTHHNIVNNAYLTGLRTGYHEKVSSSTCHEIPAFKTD